MRTHLILLLLISIIFLQSCTPSIDAITANNNGSITPSPREKHRVISRVFGGNSLFQAPVIRYDSLGRIASFTGVTGDYLVFSKNDTIHHILNPRTSFNGTFSRTSWIFQYRTDKKCYRVLQKYFESGNSADFVDSNPFWSDESNASNYTIDSLVYNATGQLVEIWQPSHMVCKLVYDSVNALVPSKMKDYYDYDRDGIFEHFKYQTSLTYTNIDQPACTQLWFFPFLNFDVLGSPKSPPSGSSYFIVQLKKAVRQFSFSDDVGNSYFSPNFEYKYNSDSTRFTGTCNPEDLSGWFGYDLTKQ